MEMIKIVTCDGVEMDVEKELLMKSKTLANMLEDLPDFKSSEAIPIGNVPESVFKLVLQYLEYHRNDPEPDPNLPVERRLDDIVEWDRKFCPQEHNILFPLILAANFLEIKPLLDLTCKNVALQIKGKTPEEIRQHFNIKNDFTPEEEEQVRRENAWCEER